MSGGQLTAVLIVAMVMVAGIIRARFGYSRRHYRGDDGRSQIASAETERLREEVKQLKERLHVLERITVEKENSLEREIESLRDR
jgi:uncharacterized protein YlxW (UPF0749 family)